MSVPGLPAQPPPAPYLPPPQRAPGVNGFAIAALVCGILAIVPVAIICGCVALYQISRNGGTGKGMAIGGLVAATLWVVGIIVAVTVLVSSVAERDASGRITEAGYLDETSLEAGDCVNDPDEDDILYRVVPCREPHESEIFAKFDLEGDGYPGVDSVQRRAEAGCRHRIDDVAFPRLAGALSDVLYFSPDRVDWAVGDRYVLCFAILKSERRGEHIIAPNAR